MPVNTIDLLPGSGGGNAGLAAEAHVTGVDRLSLGSTGQSVSPVITFASEMSLGFWRSAGSTLNLSYGTLTLAGDLSFGGASRRIIPGPTDLRFYDTANANANIIIADAGGLTLRSTVTGATTITAATFLSTGTVDVRTNGAALSLKTYADAPSAQTTGNFGIIQNASGFSCFFSSGKSIYYWGGSTLSAVQP